MRIEEITKQRLSNASDLELKRLNFKIATFWDRHFAKNSREIVGCFKRSDFIAKYRLLKKEMDSSSRSLQHSTCDIDRQAFKQSMQAKTDGIDLPLLSEMDVIQNYIVLDENFTKADEVNVMIQSIDSAKMQKFLEDNKDILKNAITEILKEQTDKQIKLRHAHNFKGVGISLYDLILRPVSKIEKVEIKNNEGEEIKKDIELVPIEKGDEQIVYGIVYEPDTEDAQGDQASAEEIKKAAYDFMENVQTFKVMHKGKKVKVKILENYIAPVDFTINKREVRKGSWVLVTRVLDKKLWQDIKAGNLTGYSMAGYAKVD